MTNVKVFPNPSPTRDAVAFIDALLATPGVEMPEIGREWPMLRNLCQESGFGGDDMRDLWIAAAVKTMHGHLVTFDKSFSRMLSKGELTVLSIACTIESR